MSYTVAQHFEDFNRDCRDFLTWINTLEKSSKKQIVENSKTNMKKLARALGDSHKGISIFLEQGFFVPPEVASKATNDIENFLNKLDTYKGGNYQILYVIIFTLYKQISLNVSNQRQPKETYSVSVDPTPYPLEYILNSTDNISSDSCTCE